MEKETYHSRMQRKLASAFAPIAMEIHDDSAQHAGHAGHDPRGETHFRVLIVSPVFKGLGRVPRHREVYRVVAEEMEERVHALVLQCLAPDEYTNK